MANDGFPWDLIIIFIAVGVIAGFTITFILFQISENEDTEVECISEGAGCSKVEKEANIMADVLRTICDKDDNALFHNFRFDDNGSIYCDNNYRIQKNMLDIVDEFKEYKSQYITKLAEYNEAVEFINGYMPNEYYCTTTVPLQYQLPVKQQLNISKTREVNVTEPIYEHLISEFYIPAGITITLNNSQYSLLSNNTVNVSVSDILNLNNLVAHINGTLYQLDKYVFQNTGSEDGTLRIEGDHPIGEQNITKTETYYEDIYDYKNETTKVCKAVKVTIPMNLNFQERLKLKQELESKNCYLSETKAYQNCGRVMEDKEDTFEFSVKWDYGECDVDGNQVNCFYDGTFLHNDIPPKIYIE